MLSGNKRGNERYVLYGMKKRNGIPGWIQENSEVELQKKWTTGDILRIEPWKVLGGFWQVWLIPHSMGISKARTNHTIVRANLRSDTVRMHIIQRRCYRIRGSREERPLWDNTDKWNVLLNNLMVVQEAEQYTEPESEEAAQAVWLNSRRRSARSNSQLT